MIRAATARLASTFALLAASGLAFGSAACAVDSVDEQDGLANTDAPSAEDAEDAATSEAALTQTELQRREQICSQIRPGAPWSPEEAQRFHDVVVKHIVDVKRENDRLIRERGVGSFLGVRTDAAKRIVAGDRAGAAAILRPRLRSGNVDAIVAEMSTAGMTSCVGWAMRAFAEGYRQLGRTAEWRTISACTRAWDSSGTRMQAAMVRAGWPGPTLPIAGDVTPSPSWDAENAGLHRGLLASSQRGSYFGAPVSRTARLVNFLPAPGTGTTRDDAGLLALGQSKFLALGTLRAAYHVFVVVPAASVPEEVATWVPNRSAWLAARRRGEPFVLESHASRQAWDPTSFEIRPLTEVMAESYGTKAVYSTGTLLFAPESPGRPSL